MSEVAVFPLPVVVFPGMTVPLHVYEERYKRLVRHAQERDPPRFAIAPPPRDRLQEGGEPAPGAVGTLVEVIERSENLDGTVDVVAHGRERCRLRYLRSEAVPETGGGSDRPLWFAEVEDWPLRRDDPNEEQIAAWDALEAFERYGRAFFAPQARKQAAESMPDDPLYQASFVCANLRLPTPAAQRLLEADSLADRFRRARSAIDERLAGNEADGDEAET